MPTAAYQVLPRWGTPPPVRVPHPLSGYPPPCRSTPCPGSGSPHQGTPPSWLRGYPGYPPLGYSPVGVPSSSEYPCPGSRGYLGYPIRVPPYGVPPPHRGTPVGVTPPVLAQGGTWVPPPRVWTDRRTDTSQNHNLPVVLRTWSVNITGYLMKNVA